MLSNASIIAINAEIFRAKARLLEKVPKLQRLAMKKVFVVVFLLNLILAKMIN